MIESRLFTIHYSPITHHPSLPHEDPLRLRVPRRRRRRAPRVRRRQGAGRPAAERHRRPPRPLQRGRGVAPRQRVHRVRAGLLDHAPPERPAHAARLLRDPPLTARRPEARCRRGARGRARPDPPVRGRTPPRRRADGQAQQRHARRTRRARRRRDEVDLAGAERTPGRLGRALRPTARPRSLRTPLPSGGEGQG